MNTQAIDDRLHWYKDAIIYELHIKAFSDSNGDGIGDFAGLLQRLDYLQELGVTAIWVLPFYPSPLRDDGYDIADYYSINPSYGTIEEFRRFLDEAHRRNLRVITELVINHTSDQHPWFQRARQAPKGSPERDFYVWTDDPSTYKDVRIIFQDFEASNWSWDPVAQQYYWHRFFHHQPDLNYDNPQVQEEVIRILDYWSAMGVDGFRLDAVPYLFEREGTNGENLPETHAFLKKLRSYIDEKYPGTVFLAEANMWPEDSASYFGNGDECHMNYHFPVMPRMFMALQREDRYPITDIFDQTPEIPPTCQWAMFLRNHDELTLEMVTDEERDYMYRVYAKDPKARINLGIRHRLAPLMDNDRRKIELMNSLLFSMPGTPVIYYGDEIGMGDNFYLGDRDGVRTPMQWSPDRNAGFSATNPQRLYLPVIIDPEYNYEAVNVELQKRNTSSLFWFMKRIISVRKKHRVFGRGDMKFIHAENPKILCFTRSYGEEILLVVVNLSKYAQATEIDLASYASFVPVEVFSQNRFPAIREAAPYFFTLGPHSFQWFILEPAVAKKQTNGSLAMLELSRFSELLEGDGRTALENLLPHYLQQCSWFQGKDRRLFALNIYGHEALPIEEAETQLLLLEAVYESGLPEYYQLPLSFAPEPVATGLAENEAHAVVARMRINGRAGVLCDAFYLAPVQQWIFSRLRESATVPLGEGSLRFHAAPAFAKSKNGQPPRPKMHTANLLNTSITFGKDYFLKMYRRIDRGIHPDVELTRFLTEEKNFPYTPAYLGSVEWQTGRESFTLGMMQVMVENHGDGQSFMAERLANYIERLQSRDLAILHPELRLGTLTDPVPYEALPEELQTILGGPAAEQCHTLGVRTGELHRALASGVHKDFIAEDYSLHYQRSLFSSLQSIVRETYSSLERRHQSLPPDVQASAAALRAQRNALLARLKRIYSKKLDVSKTRVHGNLHLKQILFTGKEIAIQDFSGNLAKSFSERRLKRSPLRDAASMIRSFYYAAYEAFFNSRQISPESLPQLLPFASMWAHYMGSFFMHGYVQTVSGSSFLPQSREDLYLMLETFLLEKALQALNTELNLRPHYAIIPLQLIESLHASETA